MTVNGSYNGSYAFDGVKDTIKNIAWMDNQEQLNFMQQGEMLTVDFTGQKYGVSYCVRVAVAEI